MRPIDADEAANLFLRMAYNYQKIGLVEASSDYEALARIVRNPECLPTIDAVVVVRCKDCKYRLPPTGMCINPMAMGIDALEPEDDDFCSRGERKDEGDEKA